MALLQLLCLNFFFAAARRVELQSLLEPLLADVLNHSQHNQELHEEAADTYHAHIAQEADASSASKGLCCCRKHVLHSDVVRCVEDTSRVQSDGKLACQEFKSGAPAKVDFQARLDEKAREIYYEGTIQKSSGGQVTQIKIEAQALSAATFKAKALTGKKRSGHTSECGRLSFGYSTRSVYKTLSSAVDYLSVDYEAFHCKVKKGSCNGAFSFGGERFSMDSSACHPGVGWTADRLPELCT